MCFAIGADQGGCGLEAELSTGSVFDSVEDLVQGLGLGVLTQAREEVFLQRLSGCGSTSSEHRVYVVGHVLHLNAGHTGRLAPFWRQSMRNGAILGS